jgi:hypothetical protein
MSKCFRQLPHIVEEINELRKTIPPRFIEKDFAAMLQWSSWQNHLNDLNKELKVTAYNQLVNHRGHKETLPFETFEQLVELEELTQEELTDVDYLDDRMDVWNE